MNLNTGAWLDEYVARLHAHGIAVPGALVGCTEFEVDGIEKEFGVGLPGLYRQALVRFGRSAGKLVDVNEFEFYFDDIVTLNRWIRGQESRDLQQRRRLQLPRAPYFVLLARYREVFQYVQSAPGAADATVYQLELDEDAPGRPVYSSVTMVLEALLQDHLPLH
jgi:hypothetical protein